MRDILEAVAAGEMTPEAAEAELAGYVTTEAGRFDAARESRSGVPEAVLAEGKTPDETVTLAAAAVESTGRALITRIDGDTAAALYERFGEDLSLDERAGTATVHAPAFEGPDLDAEVAIVTAGTSDAEPAGEAAAVVREMGADVVRVDDVGVASIDRALDQRDVLTGSDVLIVAAGREGALPTVIAGMVDTPVIGLPVSTGYGHAGQGEAALSGMLQSCTALSVVNIDAGFTAGTQAGLIARRIDAARAGD